MDREDISPALNRSFNVGPTPALVVPEAELVALTFTAREFVFGVDRKSLRHTAQRQLFDALDRTSEPFADMLDLPLSEATARRKALNEAAGHVRAWLDGDCVTMPPVQHIRALVEALT